MTQHHRRPPTDAVHLKQAGGSHRITYEPLTGYLTFGAHGAGHDLFAILPGLTKPVIERIAAGYTFTCCDEAA